MRVRISAVHIENGLPQTDRLVLVVALSKDGAVADEECFGVVIDGGDRNPFSGVPDGGDFVLDYGVYAKGDVVSRINIVGKRMKVGELFTRSDYFRGDSEVPRYTYRVEYLR